MDLFTANEAQHRGLSPVNAAVSGHNGRLIASEEFFFYYLAEEEAEV